MLLSPKVLHLDTRGRAPDHLHSAQVKRPSVSKDGRKVSVRSQNSMAPSAGNHSTTPSTPVSGGSEKPGVQEGPQPAEASPQGLQDMGRSSSSLHASCSPNHMSLKEPTPSIASDISLPIATQELRQRLRQLEKYVGSTVLLTTPGTGTCCSWHRLLVGEGSPGTIESS